MLLEDYEICILRDSCEPECIYNFILLNKKHNVKDFQKEIYSSKKRHEDEISEFGNDFEYIFGDTILNDKFDYLMLDINDNNNLFA